MSIQKNTVVGTFQEIVKQYSNSIAIVGMEHNITYSELNKQANQLANYLSSIGIRKGSKVAILITRSIDMVVAMLAILKNGAIYVPLAIDHPLDRIEYIINDTKPEILLYNSIVKEKANHFKIKSFCVDNNDQTLIGMSPDNLDLDISEEECAYIMYTSGSTGMPKGVMTSHKNITHIVINPNYANISNTETFLQLSPYDFDGATFEIWGALLNAAKLVMMPAGMPVLKIIADKIETYDISILFITTQLFNSMVESRLESLTKIKQILFGGEVASIPHVQKLMSVYKGKLANIYGPTECTCFACYYPITASKEIVNNIPIGAAVQNTNLYLFDEHMNLVTKNNTSGELYIGSPGISLGYLHGNDITLQKFITNPLSNAPNDVLFKTGDIVQIDQDQNINFIGRQDNQVKIRGFRISLEEIELAIKQFHQVKNVVVIWKTDSLPNKLIAHIVPNDEGFQTASLKNFLKEHYPAYMIPNYILIHKELPLNLSGKIDRFKIATSYSEINNIPANYINSKTSRLDKSMLIDLATQTENDIAQIWREILNLDTTLSTDEDFFELGGDSLLAIMALDKYQQHKSNTVLPNLIIADVFNSSTIKLLAQKAVLNFEQSHIKHHAN